MSAGDFDRRLANDWLDERHERLLRSWTLSEGERPKLPASGAENSDDPPPSESALRIEPRPRGGLTFRWEQS